MRFYFLILFLSLAPFLGAKEVPKVLVSVAPQRFLVQQIVGDDLMVDVIVPPESSPHTYQPTPKQMVRLTDALMWFQIGESFEPKLLKVLKNKVEVVDTTEKLSLLQSTCCHGHAALDLHIWLSPKLLKEQTELIADRLCERFPEYKEPWRKNTQKLLIALDTLDNNVSELLKEAKGRSVLVSHPAFAYFCQDYGLTQLSIESDGKEPTARQITELLRKAASEHISCIFAQEQYSRRGAKTMAAALGVEIAFLDPYAEDVIHNIHAIAQAFHDSL